MPNPVFASLPTTIFQHMTALALKHEAINLGQGFPDQDGPDVAARGGGQAADRRPQPVSAHPGAADAAPGVSAHAAQFYGLDYDPEDEVLVTSGGTEALTGAHDGHGGAGRRSGADRADL